MELKQGILITGAGEISPKHANTREIHAPFNNYVLRTQLWRFENRLKQRPEVIEFDLKGSNGQNVYIASIERAFNQMLDSAKLQVRLKRKEGERIGFIYIDFFKGAAIFKEMDRIKDTYYLDIFPKFLKKSLPFEGISFKLLADRNSAIEAILLAKDLLESGDLDRVIIGGLFAVFDSFAVTELLKTDIWDKQRSKHQIKPKNGFGFLPFCERSIFIVLENSDVSKQPQRPQLLLESIQQSSKSPLENLKKHTLRDSLQCYSAFSNARKQTSSLQNHIKNAAPQTNFLAIEEEYGDSFSLNVLVCFYDILKRIRENKEKFSHFLVLNGDRFGDFSSISGRVVP